MENCVIRAAARVLAAAAVLLISANSLAAAAEDIRELRVEYEVQALGGKIGELRFAGVSDGVSYAATAVAFSTGLVKVLANIRIEGKIRGWVTEEGWKPFRYQGTRTRKDRVSKRVINYRDGAPASIESDPPRSLDEGLTQEVLASTIDPVTLLYFAFQAKPVSELCNNEFFVFDGGRMARVALGEAVVKNSTAVCEGDYTRMFGYSVSEMSKDNALRFTVEYSRDKSGEDLFVLRSFETKTSYGTLSVVKR